MNTSPKDQDVNENVRDINKVTKEIDEYFSEKELKPKEESKSKEKKKESKKESKKKSNKQAPLKRNVFPTFL
mgnify:CR=1 FL=1